MVAIEPHRTLEITMDLATTLGKHGIDTTTLAPVPGWKENGILQLKVAGNQAYNDWQQLRELVPESNHWPIITSAGFPEWASSSHGGEIEPHTVVACHEILTKAQSLSFETWVKQQRNPAFQVSENIRIAEMYETGGPKFADLVRLHRQFAEDFRNAPPWSFDPANCKWPDKPPYVFPRGLWTILLAADGWLRGVDEVVEKCAIVLIPTRRGWEMPAYLGFGGLNSCPMPEVHVAALQWLHDKYGGEVCAMGIGKIEVLVSRRPESRDEALRLAEDLRWWAQQLVPTWSLDTGYDAAYLMATDQWVFSWD